MALKFKVADIKKLIDHANAAPEHAPLYGDKRTAIPGLWLVGDQGVYLMSNGRPQQDRLDGSQGVEVVYAEGINPHVDGFDTWWERKRIEFGGDDGVDFLALSAVEKLIEGMDTFVVVLGENSIQMGAEGDATA